MASSTGIPARAPAHISADDDANEESGYSETSPLLGRRGDASQKDGRPIYHNLIIGTAPLAQIAVLLLVAHISSTILLSAPVSLFTAHPLLNAFALLMLTQSLLLLQPTHTAEQKRSGALLHALLNLLALLAFVAALAIILANKFAHHGVHFASAHARLGLLTYIYLLLQAAVGATMYFLPAVYGGEERAKKIWKWHRASGYLALLLVLGTVLAACWTDFNVNVLGVKVWAVIVCEVFIILGIGARIRLDKLGWMQTQT